MNGVVDLCNTYSLAHVEGQIPPSFQCFDVISWVTESSDLVHKFLLAHIIYGIYQGQRTVSQAITKLRHEMCCVFGVKVNSLC